MEQNLDLPHLMPEEDGQGLKDWEQEYREEYSTKSVAAKKNKLGLYIIL